MSLTQLEIKLDGRAEVRWTQTKRNHNDRKSHTVTYHATHPCIDQTYHPGSGDNFFKIKYLILFSNYFYLICSINETLVIVNSS
jgi:hypothetical protein